MKLALECSDELLDMMQPFADFDWVSVGRYLESKVYAEYYRSSDNVKFIGSSPGDSCPIEDLKKVLEDCEGTYAVAPDQANAREETLRAYTECASKLPKDVVIGVLQGSTPEDALRCLDTYESKIVAVPCRVGGSEEEDPGELVALRRELVVAHIPADRIILLLGFASTSEFAWYTNRSNVWGLYTGAPIQAGLASQDIDDFGRAQKVDVELNKDNWAAVCRNIALLRKYMS